MRTLRSKCLDALALPRYPIAVGEKDEACLSSCQDKEMGVRRSYGLVCAALRSRLDARLSDKTARSERIHACRVCIPHTDTHMVSMHSNCRTIATSIQQHRHNTSLLCTVKHIVNQSCLPAIQA